MRFLRQAAIMREFAVAGLILRQDRGGALRQSRSGELVGVGSDDYSGRGRSSAIAAPPPRRRRGHWKLAHRPAELEWAGPFIARTQQGAAACHPRARACRPSSRRPCSLGRLQLRRRQRHPTACCAVESMEPCVDGFTVFLLFEEFVVLALVFFAVE